MEFLATTLVVASLLMPATDAAAEPATAIDRTYAAADSDIVNPERGIYSSIDLVNETELGWFADDGYSLASAYIRLDDYRNSAIPQSFLDDLTTGLDAAREAGIKIIFRASYNFGIGEEDASKSRVLQHISQLQPIWVDNQDVIAVVQAGFIGAWGEWHSSTNGLTEPAVKAEIRDAILAAVPNTRMVQFRYLTDLSDWYPTPLGEATAYTASDISRTSHHNDCFLATDDDAGTYWPGNTTEHKSYLGSASEFMVIGGETCQVGFDANQARRSCAVAEAELAQFHWSYLNDGWHEPTLQIWKDQGCWDDIQKALGYRYRLTRSQLPQQVTVGGSITADISITNDGYATLFNQRPVYLVLDGPTRIELELDTDPRQWTADETTIVPVDAWLPSDIPTGTYTFALWMPDASASLQNRPDYAIQLANQGTWDASNGYNILGDVTVVAATACSGTTGSRFADVGIANTFCADVEWLAGSGITKGCNPPANDMFCPEDPATRAQMAAFLHRALPTTTTGPATLFADTVGTTFETDITWLGTTGITKGCNPPTNDMFCPNQPVTRGQMAAFLHRALS